MPKIYITFKKTETIRLGRQLAKRILVKGPQKQCATVICLEGKLGSGKTTFLQGFVKGLGIKAKALSPTFLIMKKFPISKSGFLFFYHFDFYRIKNERELAILNVKEISLNPQNILAIEWPDKAKRILPKNRILLKFLFLDKNKREITINSDIRTLH